jgi:UDP-glucose 4-epimerase
MASGSCTTIPGMNAPLPNASSAGQTTPAADDARDPGHFVPPPGPVLVAGGAGYIGSHCVRLLLEKGADVVVLDNLSTGHMGNFEIASAGRATFVRCYLADRPRLAEVFAEHAPSSVIHFAAKCYVGESVTEPAKYYQENVGCTWNLLEAMRAADCRELVFSSTCATYGEPVEIPITEAHPQNPINPYGRTKLHMEHMIEDYGRAYGLRWAALRYFNAAGCSPVGDMGESHDPETHLIPLVLQVALGQRNEIAMFGDDYDTPDGTCIRDYIHVDDLADAHLRALAVLATSGGPVVCNLGTGEGYSVKELIELAREITGHAIPARVAPRRAGDPARLVCGGTRGRDLLGWVPARSDLRTILEDAWRWHRAHPKGAERGV